MKAVLWTMCCVAAIQAPAYAQQTATQSAVSAASGETGDVALLEVRHQGDVAYVSGGVGEGEREALRAQADRFNLRMELAAKNGEYISNANVSVRNRSGEEVLNVVPEGPLLYAKLPAGSYTISADYAGKTQQKRVTLGAASSQKVGFYW